MSLISKTTAWKTLLLLAPISIGCFLFLWRLEQLAGKARQTLNENPVIRQHIGTIDRIRLNLFATRLEAGSWLEQLRAGRVEWVFRVEGEKSGGLVRARFVFSRCGGHRRVLRGEDWRIDAIDAGALRLPTGVQHDLLATADSPQQAVRRVSSGQEASTAGAEASGLRFVDQQDGTVKDTEPGGLIWLKDANCLGKETWQGAMEAAVRLKSGVCGLADGSEAGDWRLPTKEEWETMVAPACPAAPKIVGNGGCYVDGAWAFDVQSSYYWSSNREHGFSDLAWDASLGNGSVATVFKDFRFFVWPVRGGP